MNAREQIVTTARDCAENLRKLATQAEAIRWRPEAVMRENASLLLTMAQEMERLHSIIAWYWRTHGPYPSDIDKEPS